MKRICDFLSYVLFAPVVLLSTFPSYAAPLYSFTHFQNTLGPESVAWDINDKGQVVGYGYLGGQQRAFMYESATGQMINLGALSPNYPSYAAAINSSGQVVGYSYRNTYDISSAVLFENGGIKDLGALTRARNSNAASINDAGQIVGTLALGDRGAAFIYDPIAGLRIIDTGGRHAIAEDINASGVVVGTSVTPEGAIHAFMYLPGTGMTDLGAPEGSFSTSMGINDLGQALVTSWGPSPMRSYVHTPGQGMSPLGYLGLGLDSTMAMDINNRGQVVGNSAGRAFLYDGGTMFDLNDLVGPLPSGWFLMSAEGINEAGQIAGFGLYNGVSQAFLLSPLHQIPEPSTLLLASLGLALIACCTTSTWRQARRCQLE